jgi:hypothetical protein
MLYKELPDPALLPASFLNTVMSVSSYGDREVPVILTAKGWEMYGEDCSRTETVLSRCGFVGNRTADDWAALQTAIFTLIRPGKLDRFVMPPGIDARINKQIVYYNSGSYIMNGFRATMDQMVVDPNVVLDYYDEPGQYAWLALGQPDEPHNRYSFTRQFTDMVLLLPGHTGGSEFDNTLVSGFGFGQSKGKMGEPLGHMRYSGIVVEGGRDQFGIHDRCYLMEFANVQGLRSRRRGFAFYGRKDSGESIGLSTCNFSESRNALGTGCNFYMDPKSAGASITAFNSSLDYGDIGFQVYSGAMHWIGGWMETRSMQPYGTCKYTGGCPTVMVDLQGVHLKHASDFMRPDVYEDPEGRPVFFLIESTSGDRLTFNLKACKYEGYRMRKTKLVEFQGLARVRIAHDIMHNDPDDNGIGWICDRTNNLPDVSKWSYPAVPANAPAGTAQDTSNKFSSIPVQPGRHLILVGVMSPTALSGLTLRFKDVLGNEVGVKSTPAPINGVAATAQTAAVNAHCSISYHIPPGAVTVQVWGKTAEMVKVGAWIG